MTRSEKITKMLDAVCDWDTDSMIFWIQYRLEEEFRPMNDAKINEEYNAWFDLDDDEENEITQRVSHAEYECSVCHKNNDVGSKCYWCGN